MEVPQHMTQPCLLRTMDGQAVAARGAARLPGPLCISCSSVPESTLASKHGELSSHYNLCVADC